MTKNPILNCLKRYATSSITALLLFAYALTAHAALSPEVVKGVNWLQTQVQPDGTILSETSSLATPLQNRAEALLTLKQLATAPAALDNQVAADTEINTEYLSRRALIYSLSGRDNSALLTELAARQNFDGGYGGAAGHESNVLDTARVLLSFSYSGYANDNAALGARFYLINNIQADGGLPGSSVDQRLSQTALGLSALLSVATDVATTAATQQLAGWLLSQQGLDGGWNGDPYLTAEISVAILPSITDSVVKSNARTYLLAAQGVDGSWGGDAFVTALALRALSIDTTTSSATGATLSGQVVSLGSGASISGATVTLAGSSIAPVQTGAGGLFSFANLPAGSYTLQVSKNGYNTYSQTYAVNAGQLLDVGAVALQQLATTGIVRGRVIAAATGQALAGVAISVSGTTAASTTTDTFGNYEINTLTAGAFTVSASLNGYTTVSGSGTLLAGQTQLFSPSLYAVTDTSAPTTGHLTGQVVAQDSGAALGGVLLQLNGINAGVTGADGRFDIVTAPSSYHAVISLAGYTTATSDFLLTAGANVSAGTIALAKQNLATSSIRGQVIAGATSLPLAGVTVSVTGAATATALTDASGAFEITGLAPGAVSVTAGLTGYTSVTASATTVAGEVLVFSPSMYAVNDPTAPTTGHLIGQVVAQESGLAMAGVDISLNGASAGTTGIDGRFDLLVSPADYHVDITFAGYDTATGNFLMTAGANVDTGTIILIKSLTSTTVHGVVTDQNTGLPIAGATVQLVNGTSAITGADGSYTLGNLAGLSFDLRISAIGFTSQAMQLQVVRPSDITRDFALQSQAGSGLDLSALNVTPVSVADHAEVDATTTISNPSGVTSTAGVMFLDVLDAQGTVVGAGSAYDSTGTHLLGSVAVNPGNSIPAILRWNSGQYAPGTYTLVARISEAGSVNAANPRGRILAERTGTVEVTGHSHFAGTVTADPPVSRANTNTPIHLSAMLQNDGNVGLTAQTYQLQVVDTGTGVVAHTEDVVGVAFAVGELQPLTYTDWLPAAGGNFRIDISVATDPALGKISLPLYVGDAATGNFTVNKSAVPAGTQTVKANIHISGQDVTQGTISDPLAPLIKTAIQKAVTYNDHAAVNWTMTNRCLGCHVQTQALVGGEMTRHLTTYSVANRRTLFNVLTNNQRASGMIDTHYEASFGGTETTLALWGLNAWHGKTEIASTLVNASEYLMGRQLTDGHFYADHASGWWAAATTNTAFNMKSLIDVSLLLKDDPAVTPYRYTTSTWVNGNGINGSWNMASDDLDNVYVSNYYANTVSKVSPDGTVQLFMSGVPGPRAALFDSQGNFYVIGNAGLYMRNPDGTATHLSQSRGTGLALGPDGNFYVADYWGNKILKMTPQGVTTDYIVGGALSNPVGLAFSDTGDLLVTNYSNYKILRYKADKTYEVMVEWTNGQPYNIVHDGTGWLVGTTTGLYRYNVAWEGERLLYTTVYGLTRTPSGRIVSGTGNTVISNVIKTPVANERVRLDVAIGKAFNWLYADTTYDATSNLELAHRLIGFGAAKSYWSGTTMEPLIQAKIDQTAATLRARQHMDGGWGRFSTSVSDSMVTAQVGVALDYTNPSPQDPVVQNAIKYLLATQLPDGSWYSQNGMLATHMSATTWVAIWLPIALDRIAGIDTDLSVTLPANVALSNPTLAPASTQTDAAGSTTYLWKIQGVTTAGRDIGFDATLSNMAVNEVRPVASDAHLTFTNYFTQGKVDAPIVVPTVTGSAFMTVGVSTDFPQYGPNAPVTVAALVDNLASTANNGTVQLEIYAADNVLVSNLGTVTFTGVAALGQQIQNAAWNTGAYASGGYYAKATLFDAQNAKVATATAQFSIVNGLGGALAGAGISVDKLIYQAYDNVQIADRISNLTQNQMLDAVTAVTTMYNTDGTVRWTQSAPLGQMIAGDLRNLSYSVPLINAPAGSYRAVLEVRDQAGAMLATAETAFTVQSTAATGSGLQGTVTATPKQVPQGEPAVLGDSVVNMGNAALTGVPVTLTVVDPANQQVMEQWPLTLDLAMSQTVQNVYSYATDNLPVGSSYVAVLSAVIGGKTITLAQDTFTIVEPPVKLDVMQSISNPTRLLVLMSCPSYAYATTSTTTTSITSTGTVGVVYTDSMSDQERKRLCAEDRAAFLTQLLGQFDVHPDFVYDESHFGNGLRSGNYNAYWVSGHAIEIHDDLVYEMREAVYRGDALIIEDARDDLYDKLKEATGAGVMSSLNPTDLTINVGGALYQAIDPAMDGGPTGTPVIDPVTGRIIPSLDTVGAGHGMTLRNGILQAEFSNVTSETRGTTTIIQPDAIYPAIVSHDFGRGKSLMFAFDLTGSMKALLSPNQWTTLAQESLAYIWPILPDVYVGREHLAISTGIQNPSLPVDLITHTYLPADTLLMSTQPPATLDPSGNPVWNFSLPASQYQSLNTTVRLPNISGTHTFDTTVDSTRNGVLKPYGSYPLSVDVVVALDNAASWASEIGALPLSGKDRENRDSTVANLNAALSSANSGYITQAMTELMAAIDYLRVIKAIDVLPYRVNLDRLLKEFEYRRYCASVQPRPAECGP